MKLKVHNDDQRTGIEIVKKALSWPARQIAINAGEDGSIRWIVRTRLRADRLCQWPRMRRRLPCSSLQVWNKRTVAGLRQQRIRRRDTLSDRNETTLDEGMLHHIADTGGDQECPRPWTILRSDS
jgi:hypothetical protein